LFEEFSVATLKDINLGIVHIRVDLAVAKTILVAQETGTVESMSGSAHSCARRTIFLREERTL
jgi:hypothetical protein